MNRGQRALPRTELTVKEFLTDLCDPDHAVRKLTFAADTRIARMFWPEKVSHCNDAQMSGWTCYGFKPFSNLSDAVALLRHATSEPRLTIEVGSDVTRVTVFSQGLQAGVMAEDPQPEYAVCKALLNSWLVFHGAMYGYVLGMGLLGVDKRIFPRSERPRIDMEEIARHRESGDILRDGLGSEARSGERQGA